MVTKQTNSAGSSSRVAVGFGSADVSKTWHDARPLVDELQMGVMVAQEQGQLPAAMAVTDLGLIKPALAMKIRDAIAKRLHTTADRVGVFCTQNHGTPYVVEPAFDLELLCELSAQAAGQALERAVPAQMAYIQSVAGPELIIRRRLPWPEVGTFSFFFGYDLSPDGRADGRQLLKGSLASIYGQRDTTLRYRVLGQDPEAVAPPQAGPLPADTTLPLAADPLLQGVFFRTTSGQPIGAVARFSAHPAVATGLDGVFSGDYPVYVRRQVAEAFGGSCLFFTGPCGNQCAPVAKKSLELAKKIGSELGKRLTDGLSQASWQAPSGMAVATHVARLPLDPSLARDAQEAKRARDHWREQLSQQVASGVALRTLKQTAEKLEKALYVADGHFTDWTGLGYDHLQQGFIEHPLFGLRVGAVSWIGLPGEPFGEYSVNIRRQTAAPCVVMEEGNGYLSYFPTAAEHALGGYEPSAGFFAPQVEEELMTASNELSKTIATVTREEVQFGLQSLGIKPGDAVFVHTSLRSFGKVQGGANTVVEAFLNVVGEQGTVAMPAFSDFFWNSPNQTWDREKTPSTMGAISEALRLHPKAKRSGHAPHSISAIGPLTDELVSHDSGSDFGEHSSFACLLREDAWMVLLGVDFNVCTMLHLVEDRLQIPYRRWQELKGTVIINGQAKMASYPAFLRYPGVSNDFITCGRALERAGLVRQFDIGRCHVRAIRAKALCDFVSQRVREDPFYLVSADTKDEAKKYGKA